MVAVIKNCSIVTETCNNWLHLPMASHVVPAALSMSDDFASEYASSLSDLSVNSKPLINMLTMLAEENAQHAPAIVQTVEQHLQRVKPEIKLPVLYLIDSIVKNIGGSFLTLFTQNIVSTFCAVFEKVDEKTRASMFKLRQTWNEVFPSKKLYAIDVRVNAIDPAWPITAPPPTSIHVNPRFLKAPGGVTSLPEPSDEQMREELLKKRLELLELQQQKIKLELKHGEDANMENGLQKQKELLELQTKKIEMEMELLGLQARHNKNESLVETTKVTVASCLSSSIDQKTDTDLRNSKQDLASVKQPLKLEVVSDLKNSKSDRPHRDPRLVGRLKQTEEDLKREEKNREVAAQLREQLKDLKHQTKLEALKGVSSLKERSVSINDSVNDNINFSSQKKSVKEMQGVPSLPSHSVSLHALYSADNAWQSHSFDDPPLDKIERKGLPKFKGARNVRGRNEGFDNEDFTVTDPLPSKNPRIESKHMNRDIDLRSLSSKGKRVTDINENSDFKRTKQELMDELFGKEDVDLRQLSSHKISKDRDSPSQTSWAKYKEKNHLIYQPSLSACNSVVPCQTSYYDNIKDVDMRPALLPTPSPSEAILHRERRGQTDSLGRPLLYVPLPEDPSERRRSLLQRALTPPHGHFALTHPSLQTFDMGAILAEAQEQVAARMLSFEQYNMLLQQVAQLEQLQHFREVQQLQAHFQQGNSWPLGLPPLPPHQLEEPMLALSEVRAPSPLVTFDHEKQLQIDGIARVVRFYGDAAIVFLDWDDPRDLTFEDGVRTVIIDERFHCPCALNDAYREYNIDGRIHQIRLGVPTRELCIDGTGYECFFGGDAVRVIVGGKQRAARLEGPPPIVRIGENRRSDLVIARMQMFIDEKWTVPVFLDAQAQRFELGGSPVVLQFADALQTLILNDRPYFGITFGGNPLQVELDGQPHNVRFPALPRDAIPGHVHLKSMLSASAVLRSRPVYCHEDLCRPVEDLRPSYEPALPIMGTRAPPPERETRRRQKATASPNSSSFDLLSSLLPSVHPSDSQGATEYSTNGALGSSPLSISELYNRLVSAGLLPSTQSSQNDSTPEAEDTGENKEIDFSSEKFKIRNVNSIKSLYRGIQCSACGVRFPTEQAELYGPHLDWHFRQNKHEKDTGRRVQSRRWFYAVSDWIQYEEIEDLEERARSWFEQQQEALDQEMETSVIPSSVKVEENEDNRCTMCYEPFEQFYHREMEEWHLRDTLRIDGKLYHPSCYQDYQSSVASPHDIQIDDTCDIESSDKNMSILPGLDLISNKLKNESSSTVIEKKINITNETVLLNSMESQNICNIQDEVTKVTDINPDNSPKTVLFESSDTVSDIDNAIENKDQSQNLKAQCNDVLNSLLLNAASIIPSLEEKIEPVVNTVEEEINFGIQAAAHLPEVSIDDSIVSQQFILESQEPLPSQAVYPSIEDNGKVEFEIESVGSCIDIKEKGVCSVENSNLNDLTQNIDTKAEAFCTNEKQKLTFHNTNEILPDTIKQIVSSGIDGNVELEPFPPSDIAIKPTKIRINLAGPLKNQNSAGNPSTLVNSTNFSEGFSDFDAPISSRPIDPILKPRLVGRKLTELPPKFKGKELSGLCVIM